MVQIEYVKEYFSYLSQNLHHLHYLHPQAQGHVVKVLVKVSTVILEPSPVFESNGERGDSGEGFQNDMKVQE